ncbi:hypothetical protein LguiB_020822 [Lonicera macranthoides]
MAAARCLQMAKPPAELEVNRSVQNTKQAKDRSYYLPLYKAALRGNWEFIENFIDKDKDALTAKINEISMTTLQVVIGTGQYNQMVQKLVQLMPTEALALTDDYGNNALTVAAIIGNKEAASILVKKNPSLLHMRNNKGLLPIMRAASNAHKSTLVFLLGVHKEDVGPCSLKGQAGVELLISIIDSGFFDVALDLVRRYPHLVKLKLDNGDSVLKAMARKSSAFPSGTPLSLWQRILYSRVPVNFENYSKTPHGFDIESPYNKTQEFMQLSHGSVQLCAEKYYTSVSQKLHEKLWEAAKLFMPEVTRIQRIKVMHHQALNLVQRICNEILSLDDATTQASLFEAPILQAAELGIHEIVEKIVDAFPDAMFSRDEESHYVLEVAIINRCENVFNLIYQMNDYKQYPTLLIDEQGNTMLHLAGRLAPPHKLDLKSGAALQMQREWQWFQAVEKLVIPTYKEKKNDAKETPAMVFTTQHKDLVLGGEKWMKETSYSCTIVAALIATVVFAAAITVPGGDNNNGLPNFFKENVFLVFAVSDAISLFTSTTSLLMFLSILTSRYAESDFLRVLPKRLIIGLVTLFLSITTMMTAFSASLYLLFGLKRAWILIPLAALACLPITSFVSLQFPLLVDLISSTYGPGIFGKQSDQPFY